MKSLQTSYGKKCRNSLLACFIGLSLGSAFGLVSCAVKKAHSGPEASEVPIETTLENDKKTIEELRKNVPAEKRAENDQTKEIMSLMGEVKDSPSRIREKFNRATQKMREAQRRESQRTRDAFNREEKRKRDDFYKKLKEERDDFNDDKRTSDQRKRFYEDQDRIRKEFTADERDKRNQFNADEKMKSDDFSNMLREKNQEFTQEMRAYTQRYNDYQNEQKLLREKKNQPPANLAPTPLKTGDDGQ
jgi:hypothetical protein